MASKGSPSDGVDEREAEPAAVSPPAAAGVDREAVAGALARLCALQTRQLAAGVTGSHEELRRTLEEGRD